MRTLPTVLIALAAFIAGAVLMRIVDRSGSHEPVAGRTATKGPKPAGKPAPPAPPPIVMVDGFQFEGMDFDTSPEFKHPSTVFPKPVKVYFRIRLKDMRSAPGTKKRANISYRRLGKSEKENGALRQLGEEDLTHVGKTNELIAYRPGLTFMAGPPQGRTTFQVYVDSQPLAKASFSVGESKS